MKNKSFETLLYSTAGIVFVAIGLVAFNVIGGVFKHRTDLTRDKAYTLSDGTRAILGKLDAPVKIRFYCTQGEGSSADLAYFKGYAKQVKDLLLEYKQIAPKGKLTIEEYDPEPESDAEDSASLDGIEAKMFSNGERFYLGLCVDMLGEKETIPFLDPRRERLLEYDLSRAITRVGVTEKPVIGIMSPLPVFGMAANPMMMQMGQQSGQQPWAAVSVLKRDFNVKRVAADAETIDDDIKVLLVIHPRGISDKAQFAIDQFVLRGGKLVAFLDPLPALIDTKEQNEAFGKMPNTGSSMDKLLKAWGLSFDTTKVVADTKFMLQVGQQGQRAPAILGVRAEGLNDKDILTAQIDDVWLPFAGAFTGTPAEGLTSTVLMQSTTNSALVDGFMANLSGENILKDFKPSGKNYAMAVRLTGKFKTAFPNGKPEDKPDDQAKADDKTAPKKADDSIKQGAGTNSVILVGDADFLADDVAFERLNIFGQIALQPSDRNGNLAFAQNALDQLTGDANLVSVRSRATLDYPLTKIQDMEAEAINLSQGEINALQEKVNEAQRKITDLQQAKKDKDQKFVLSPDQEKELENLRRDEANTNKRLKQLKKDTRQKIVARENWHKWMDILAIPVAVSLSGILMAAVKSRKTSAK